MVRRRFTNIFPSECLKPACFERLRSQYCPIGDGAQRGPSCVSAAQNVVRGVLRSILRDFFFRLLGWRPAHTP